MLASAKTAFDVTAIVHFYQPNTAERAKETGRDGTAVISPNFVLLQKQAQWMDDRSESNIRKLWSYVTRTRIKDDEQRSVGDNILPVLIAAAQHGVPSEYEVNLPLPDKFKKDPTYYPVQIAQPNDISFSTVVQLLIPFQGMRDMILNVQEQLIVPLASVKLGFVASEGALACAPQHRAPIRTLQ